MFLPLSLCAPPPRPMFIFLSFLWYTRFKHPSIVRLVQYIVYYVHGAQDWLSVGNKVISNTEHIDIRRYIYGKCIALFPHCCFSSPLFFFCCYYYYYYFFFFCYHHYYYCYLLPYHVLSLVLFTASEVAPLDYADVVIIITVGCRERVGVRSSRASISVPYIPARCHPIVKIDISAHIKTYSHGAQQTGCARAVYAGRLKMRRGTCCLL